MMNELKLSVVIPAYNEEKNLPATLTDLEDKLGRQHIPYEIIVANDNSTDGTAEVIRCFMEKNPCIRTVDCRPPNGFGRAVRSGLQAVTGDVIVIYMADASDHPDNLVAYYRKIEEGYDCVFGSRFIKGSRVTGYPPIKRVVNRIVNKCMQWMFRCRFNDLTNAFKAYRAHVIEECGPYRACHFNITIEMALSALVRKYNITQIPISWTGRTWGCSNLRIKEMGRRYLSTLLKIFAENALISDDLMADRLAQRRNREATVFSMQKRLDNLEAMVGKALARQALPDGRSDGILPLHECETPQKRITQDPEPHVLHKQHAQNSPYGTETPHSRTRVG